MNKRIKQLKEQAMEWVPNKVDSDTKIRLLNAEKFAELIVRDCVGVVKWTPTGVPHNTIIKNIKQHFGVEE